jgi:hypothetical protein
MALAAAGARAQQQQDIGWPEAVARLAAERQRAVTCAGLARALPRVDATAPLGAAYDEARAEIDGVVAGLAVALAQGSGRGAPGAALPDLERRLEAGFARREAFCRRVLDLSPPAPPGQRGVLGDLALVHKSADGRGSAPVAVFQTVRCDTGIPSLVIRLSTEQAARVSAFWLGRVRARRRRPMMAL